MLLRILLYALLLLPFAAAADQNDIRVTVDENGQVKWNGIPIDDIAINKRCSEAHKQSPDTAASVSPEKDGVPDEQLKRVESLLTACGLKVYVIQFVTRPPAKSK